MIKKINYSAHDRPPSTVELVEKMDEIIDTINLLMEHALTHPVDSGKLMARTQQKNGEPK
jgi:hypothetical protein